VNLEDRIRKADVKKKTEKRIKTGISLSPGKSN